jgi:hypothetical protein
MQKYVDGDGLMKFESVPFVCGEETQKKKKIEELKLKF